MRKVAVICDPLSAEVFMLTDFGVRPVQENEAVDDVLNEIYNQGYTLIFLTENLAVEVQAEIKAFQKRNAAIVTVIPGIGSTERLGEKMLSDQIRKVMGASASIT